jgi:hypothetical protein
MDLDEGTRGADGGAGEQIRAEHLGMSWQEGIDAGASEQVEGQSGLREKLVPQMEWKIFVCRAESCEEVIFEGPDGSFRCIASVSVGWDELQGDGLFLEELPEDVGAFIV